MIAAIRNPHRGTLCCVYWTGRKGFSAIAKTYCSIELNAADGVLQVHEHKLTCPTCIEAVKRESIKREPTPSST